MVMFKLAWWVEQELPNLLLKVTTQLLELPSSSKDIIRLLDKVGSLLSQVYQDPSKSIQEALVPLKKILISTVLINHADFDVQIFLALCLPKLIRIIAPNPPFEDKLIKKAFQVLVSSFQDLTDCSTKSFHKRLRICESMARLRSYVMLLDLECDALVLDIFQHLLASIQDDHSSLLLTHIESILGGILDEADDLLLEFLISILSQSQAMASPSSITDVMSERVLVAYASQIPLQQLISFTDEIMQSKEMED